MSEWECDTGEGDWLGSRTENNISTLAESTDRIFECLAHTHRRIILSHIHEVDRSEVDELAHHIATHDFTGSNEADTEALQARIRAQLVHAHLPKLAEAQLIEYDSRSGVVRYSPPPKAVEHAACWLTQREDIPLD